MLSTCVAVLACLWLARTTTAADTHSLRAHTHALYNKDILANIEERLRVLDTISAVQAKQSRRLDVIQDKLDRVETTLSIKLERAQLAVERLEHRLHMLQTNIQSSIEESTKHLEHSQSKIAEIAQNLTSHLDLHRHLLEKVSGAYAETWRRGLILEALMRDGLSLINVTRRELADGLRGLSRRQRDSRLTSNDLELNFARRLNENNNRIDSKMKEMLEVQKRFVDSCQRVQLDDPNQVANVLDKLINSLINKTAATFKELQSIQTTMRSHDTKVMKILSRSNNMQSDGTCRRLETAFKNVSYNLFKENELHQLTEKFVALTNRADAALQRLDARLGDEGENPETNSNAISAADRLILKLQGIKNEKEVEIDSEEDDDEIDFSDEDDQNKGYFDDGGGDMMYEDKKILSGSDTKKSNIVTARPSHLRHLRKHPYDRGP